jgi:hypothetical protein
MITKENYYSEIEQIGIATLPKPIQEMHESINELITAMGKGLENFTDAEISEYFIDKQFEALEKVLDNNSPKVKEPENNPPKSKKDENKYDIIDIDGKIIEKALTENKVIDFANTSFHYDIKDSDSEEVSTFAEAKKLIELDKDYKVIRSGTKINKPDKKPKFKKGDHVFVTKYKNWHMIIEKVSEYNDKVKQWMYILENTKGSSGNPGIYFENEIQKDSKTKTKSEKEINNSITNFVELVTPEIKFIQRFVALHGKTKTQEQILSFLNSLQKAIVTKVIRKTSPYKKEIEYIQENLILVYNKMGSKIKIEIEPERLQTLTDFAISEKQMLSITYIKQYISLHGKTGIKEKAESLLKRINKAVESGKIPENCPYMHEIKDIQIHLNEVLNDKANRLTVEAATLNSLNGICNCASKNSLEGIPKYNTTKKRINFVKEKGNIITFKEMFYPRGTSEKGYDQILVRKFITDKKGNVKIEGMGRDTNWYKNINELLNAIDWEQMEAWHKYDGVGRMPNNNQKEYKFYVVFDKKYILGGNEYKNDALDLLNDIVENYPEIKSKTAVYTLSFVTNVLKINPNKNDNWRNYNTLHGLGFFSDMLANIAANFIYDIPAIKERFSNFTNKITTPNNSVTPQTQPKSVNGLGKVNSMELKNMNFKNMGLKGKYAQLMGDPVEPCSIMIYGEPGSGKSTIVIDIAKTFASDYNKKIAFVAKEEGIGSTIQEKFKRLNAFHPNIDIYENHLPERINNYDFIIIDSVNEMGISYEELCKLNEQGKQNGVSFIYLFKSTKNGSFRGSQEFEHLVQVSLKVAGGIASTQKSRFGGHGSVKIFNNETQKIAKFPDYQKAEAYRNKISPNDMITKGDDNKYWVISPEYALLLKQQGFQIL